MASIAKETKRMEWFEVDEKSGIAKRVVETANNILKGEIVGIKRDSVDILGPGPKEQISIGDSLLIFRSSRSEDGDGAEAGLKKKVVLIDDNPVIRHLYARLFQKAGYVISTAEDGKCGFEMVKKQKPDAAVIDYHLPDIDGPEIARMIRKDNDLQGVRIFVFTGDSDEKIKKDAINAGVDTVIVKSPEANEIIEAVQRDLDD